MNCTCLIREMLARINRGLIKKEAQQSSWRDHCFHTQKKSSSSSWQWTGFSYSSCGCFLKKSKCKSWKSMLEFGFKWSTYPKAHNSLIPSTHHLPKALILELIKIIFIIISCNFNVIFFLIIVNKLYLEMYYYNQFKININIFN